jgi:hypothetical protein
MSRCLLIVSVVLFQSILGKYGVYGASLDREVLGDLGAGLVRREIQKVKDFKTSDRLGGFEEPVANREVLVSQRKERDASNDITICNDNFVVGPANGTGMCYSDHTHIITEQMCEKAAAAVGAPLANPWPTPRALDPVLGNINTHPKGCYSKVVDGVVTYHFNGQPEELPTPHIEDGEAAVCRRDKLKLGEADSNKCPSAEYKILFNEGLCEKAAICLRYMHDGTLDMDFDIDVMELTNHDHFPAGCFVHPTETPREIYYNPDKKGGTEMALPEHPKGTIVCIAESVDLSPATVSTNETSAGAEGGE